MTAAETENIDTRSTTMLAAYQTGYGSPNDVIEMRTVPVPQPAADEVLLEVAASAVNALDWHFLTGTPRIARLSMGMLTPKRKIPGADIAGTIVAIGEDVTTFAVGDEVFGEVGHGGFGEYAVAKSKHLSHRPTNLSLEESSTLGVAALTALQGLRDWGELEPGDRVLINGASGGVGTFAVQMAKALGASHVTAVCSTRNVETVESLGADRVIDYTREDFTELDEKFDVLFDNAGSKTLGQTRQMIAPGGVLVMVTGQKGDWIRPVDRMLGGVVRSKFWSQRFVTKTAHSSAEDCAVIKGMVERGEVRPVLDRRFQLEEAAEALAHQGGGHARGKSVVVVAGRN